MQPPPDDDTQRLLDALKATPLWSDAGTLDLQAVWRPFTTSASFAPESPGLYALGVTPGLRYDTGDSAVFYIGSAARLRNRIARHAQRSHSYLIRDFLTQIASDLTVAFWPLPISQRRYLLAIEAAAIRAFDRTYGTVPIGNFDYSVIEEIELPDTLIRWHPPERLSSPHLLDEFATKLGYVCERGTLTAHGDPNEASVELSFAVDENWELNISAPHEFRFARFISREEQQQRERWRVDELSAITEFHVAAWSLQKIRSLARAAKSVTPLPSNSKKIVRFAAATSDVPVPHTWGEVALAVARAKAGTWCPVNPLIVHILNGRQMLGKANLGEAGCWGGDVSGLPQIPKPRPVAWEDPDEKKKVPSAGDTVGTDELRRDYPLKYIERRYAQAMEGA